MNFKNLRESQIRILKVLVFLVCLVPLALLILKALNDELGADPISLVTHVTGLWTLRFLLITLAVTPARRITGYNWLIRFRRMLGLYAFFYGCLHLLTWLCLDKFFNIPDMLDDLSKRRFIMVGMAGWLAMVPLALTSTAWAIRRLGGRRWQQLHRLIYFSAAAGVIHFWWLVKPGVRLPMPYTIWLIVLLGLRPLFWLLKKVPLGRNSKPAYNPQLQAK